MGQLEIDGNNILKVLNRKIKKYLNMLCLLIITQICYYPWQGYRSKMNTYAKNVNITGNTYTTRDLKFLRICIFTCLNVFLCI
jgi:uncharacterized membrane protein